MNDEIETLRKQFDELQHEFELFKKDVDCKFQLLKQENDYKFQLFKQENDYKFKHIEESEPDLLDKLKL